MPKKPHKRNHTSPPPSSTFTYSRAQSLLYCVAPIKFIPIPSGDISEVVHKEFQPYQLDDTEEIERLKGIAVNSDATPRDFTEDGDLGSKAHSLFDLDFDSLWKSNKARIVEPKFQMTSA
ncbi:hypothetical protein RYX36_023901 [Vicia faba]